MAVSQTLETRLQLILEDGIDQISGEIAYKTKSFNNVKTTVTADALLLIAQALVPLQVKPLYMIKRNDSVLVTEA